MRSAKEVDILIKRKIDITVYIYMIMVVAISKMRNEDNDDGLDGNLCENLPVRSSQQSVRH